MNDEYRFWAKVTKTATCWLWTGAKVAPGQHGIFGANPRILAHRLSWQIHFGPIPAGLQVLHSCDNPPCVNPDHLMLGTQKANMQDAARKGRIYRGGTRKAA